MTRTTTSSETDETNETDKPDETDSTAEGRIAQLVQTVRGVLNRPSPDGSAGDGSPDVDVTVDDAVVEEVASAADVSPAEARAVIEQVDSSDGSEPSAAADPALREYAADLIAPASLRVGATTAQTSDVYTKTLYIEGYPQYARPKMFERLFADAEHVNVDVSIHIGSHDRLSAVGHLKSAIEDLEVRVAQKSDRSDVTVRDSTRRLKAHEDVYDLLSTGRDEAFDVGVYIILRSDDPDRLEDAADDIDAALDSQLRSKPADYRQQEGLVSGSPVARDQVNRTKTMLGGAVGTMFPFSSTSLIEEGGVLMGYHAQTDAPIVMDRYARSSYNMVVVGELGAGKSFNTKLNLLRRVARDPETIVIIIDPRGGFDHLVKTLDGKRIPVDGSCAINPLEIKAIPEHVREGMDNWDEYDPYQQARSSAIDMFDTYFAMHASGGDESYTSQRRSVLQFALNLTYALYGITNDPDTHDNPSPTIPDVRSVLGAISRQPEPFIRLSNAPLQITPEVVDDLPGLDAKQRRVTATSSPEHVSVSVLPAIDPSHIDRLTDAGITTLGDLVEADASAIARAADVSPSTADEWCEQAVTPTEYVAADEGRDAPAAADGGTTRADASSAWRADEGVEIPEGEITDWQAHARGLKLAFQPFGEGGTLGHLGQPTQIDMTDSNVVYLDLESNDTDSQTSLMTKVLFNAVYERAKTTDKRVILPIDEAWRLIKNSKSLTWLEQGTRFSRHHDLSIQYITQGLDEFYEREAGKAIINNCTIKLLHRLDDDQAQRLDLSARERNYITSATAGESHAGYSQALLAVDDEGKFPLRVEALPEEVPVIDAEAAEEMDIAYGGFQ